MYVWVKQVFQAPVRAARRAREVPGGSNKILNPKPQIVGGAQPLPGGATGAARPARAQAPRLRSRGGKGGSSRCRAAREALWGWQRLRRELGCARRPGRARQDTTKAPT